MTNRKILYGYLLQNGELSACPAEAEVVGRVFTHYAEELSYQKTADILNREKIPFSQDAPLWNKHKIKRLLENPRYTGKDRYPLLVDEETFQAVQARIGEKTSGCADREIRPALKLRLLCNRCNGRLLRLAGPNRRKDTLYLKCEGCGMLVTISDDALLGEAARQMAEHNASGTAAYMPDQEVVRLTNAVNRSLEHPDRPEAVVSLILQGISARYDCCPQPIAENCGSPTAMDWHRFGQAVSHITISAKNTVTVYFK